MNPIQSGGHRQGRPTYIHELEDWPDFHWDEEAVKQPLERVSRRQHEIVSNASNLERAAAAETTVRNLTDSAVASSRIEDEYPDPNQAPTAERLGGEMDRFLWFNQPEPEPDLRKAAIAHLWFVSIHPYDDCNGRIARAITDLALSRYDGTKHRLYSMSAEIMRQHSLYYRALEVTQSGPMNITGWMLWFFDCLTDAIEAS